MRIVFVTDIHLGATPTGWQQQPRWCEGAGELLGLLGERLRQLQPDLLILGGDLVEHGTPDAIVSAVSQLRELPGTAVVCLGNHDLTEPASYPCWRRAMWDWPAAGLADRLLEFADCDVCALNNHWMVDGVPQLRWNGQMPVAALTPAQLGQLEGWLSRRVDRPAVVALHAPLEALPGELTGATGPSETPPAEYVASVTQVLDRHPRVRVVLAGHCHAACATQQTVAGVGNGVLRRLHLSATSLTEVPYQFPVIEISGGTVGVTTHLLTPGERGPSLNPHKQWVIGRNADRTLSFG